MNKHIGKLLGLLFAALPVLLFSGCGGEGGRVNLELAGQPVYYADSAVVRAEPVVYVYPVTDVSGIKVLFTPFRVVQAMDSPEQAGYSLSRVFWQVWSGMEVFDQFEFAAEAGPFRRDLAIAQAKRRGADMVVGGFVTQLLAGGGVGPNRVSLQIEAYDVNSGLMVWSMAHSGALNAPVSRDFILFAVKNRIPDDALYAVVAALAEDTGQVMRRWSRAVRPEAAPAEEEKDPRLPG